MRPATALRAASVRLAGIERTFAGAPPFALRSVSLEVARSECVVILGPSGSGKTTLLRIIAGLERPDAGRVLFDGRDVTPEPPERRRAGVVFAEDALFPHMTAFENIAYGVARGERERVTDAAASMRVDALLGRKIDTLSGGERQRVALARALASAPAILLLDEPLARLDVPLRLALRLELQAVVRSRRYTTVLVTHDQAEAMALGDRIAIIRDGSIEQVGSPRDVYDRPANAFVARFVGTPPMAFVDAAAFVRFAVPGAASLGVRAGGVTIDVDGDVAGVVSAVEDLGGDVYAYCETMGGTLVANVSAAPQNGTNALPVLGERLMLRVEPAHVHAFDGDGRRIEQPVRV